MATENYIVQMQLERYEIFKAQDPADFDVTFEVNEKLIYANKYVLETISTTFKSMLSERWKSKDDIIKLDTYSYDNFCQFLTFIYSGTCDLTDENISNMVDMAEFYNITVFKDFCDAYISKTDYNVNVFFDFLDTVTKYYLPKSKAAIDKFTQVNFPKILQSDKFMALEKSAVESLVTFQRGPGQEEKLFESVYKWANERLESDENDVTTVDVKRERIKEELTGILPHIKFDRMNPGYFSKFVVSRGYLFTYELLSATLCDRHKITVTVTNRNKKLTGCFVDICNIYDGIQWNKGKHIFTAGWVCDSTPPAPSDLKKNQNEEFYFVLTDKQFLKVKKPSKITESDYLLCEMKGDTNFVFDCFSEMSFSRI